jgi:predicted DNA-binding transcriptional regulator AlpA
MTFTTPILRSDKEVYSMLGIGKTKWYRMKKSGLTPKALKRQGHYDSYTQGSIARWLEETESKSISTT